MQLRKEIASLTRLTWVSAVSLTVFLLIAVGLWVNSGIWPGDREILEFLHRTETSNLDRFAETFTVLGIKGGVIPVSILVGFGLSLRRQWQVLLAWASMGLGSTGIGILSKLLWHRARPHFWESFYAYPKDFSFPSGHAIASMTLVMALLLLTWSTRWRWLVLTLGGLFVVGIGWTRLYLGVHYPSDVLAGWMLAIAWVTGVRLFLTLLSGQDSSEN